jgi:hypothetical protein
MLGAPVPFSERSELEDEMMGIKYRGDLAAEAAVCGFFVDICSATKQVLPKAIFD